MSLLMDALRKAEQSKSQAEKTRTPAKPEPQVANPAELGGAGEGLDFIQADDAAAPTAKEEKLARKASPLDIPLDFEDADSIQANTDSSSQSVFDNALTEISLDSDWDSSASGLSTDAGANPIELSSDSSADEEFGKRDNAERDVDANPAEKENSSRLVGASMSSLVAKYGASSTLQSPQDLQNSEADRSDLQSERLSAEVPALNIEIETVTPAKENNTALSSKDPESKLDLPVSAVIETPDVKESSAQPDPGEVSLKDKEDVDRHSAATVFTAKRNRQSKTKRAVMAGFFLAALVVIFGGAYFYVSIQPSDSFNGPLVGGTVNRRESPTQELETAVPTETGELSNSNNTENAAESIGEATTDIADETSTELLIESIDENIETPLETAELADNSIQSISLMIDEEAAVDSLPIDSASVGTSPVNTGPTIELLEESRVQQEQSSNTDIAVTDAATRFENNVVESVSNPVALNDQPQVITAEPVNSINFSRREQISTIDPIVSEAFRAYQQGNLDDAQRLYRQVLDNTPQHRDALLGLAAIAARDDDSFTAMDLYSRLLARDPNDPVARAGLLDLTSSASPAEQERELKRLLEAHPYVAPLVYALGNFYASERRWSNAQQAYFSALRLAKTAATSDGQINPDYAYNLAVSLEHLNKVQPAIDFYTEALEHAGNYPAGFDVEAVRSRLASIGEKN